MSIRTVKNRAFSALNEALQLSGNENPSQVDLDPVSLVVDLARMMETGLLTWWDMAVEEVFAGAATQTFDVDPYEPSDWDIIKEWDRASTNGIPRNEDCFIIRAGISATSGNLTSASIFREFTDAALTLAARQLHLLVDGQQADIGINSGGPTVQQPLPWFVRSLSPDKQSSTFRAKATMSAAGRTSVYFSCLTAPPGILSRGPYG